MRDRACLRSSSVNLAEATWRVRFLPMISSRLSTFSLVRSLSTTSYPESAITCAMPLPICPLPIIPILRMGVMSSSWDEAGSARVPLAPSTVSSIVIPHAPGGSIACPFQLGLQLGQDREQIANEAIVADLEDRGLRVLVNRHDHLGILHAGEMLDRT